MNQVKFQFLQGLNVFEEFEDKKRNLAPDSAQPALGVPLQPRLRDRDYTQCRTRRSRRWGQPRWGKQRAYLSAKLGETDVGCDLEAEKESITQHQTGQNWRWVDCTETSRQRNRPSAGCAEANAGLRLARASREIGPAGQNSRQNEVRPSGVGHESSIVREFQDAIYMFQHVEKILASFYLILLSSMFFSLKKLVS